MLRATFALAFALLVVSGVTATAQSPEPTFSVHNLKQLDLYVKTYGKQVDAKGQHGETVTLYQKKLRSLKSGECRNMVIETGVVEGEHAMIFSAQSCRLPFVFKKGKNKSARMLNAEVIMGISIESGILIGMPVIVSRKYIKYEVDAVKAKEIMSGVIDQLVNEYLWPAVPNSAGAKS